MGAAEASDLTTAPTSATRDGHLPGTDTVFATPRVVATAAVLMARTVGTPPEADSAEAPPAKPEFYTPSYSIEKVDDLLAILSAAGVSIC